MVLKTLGRTTWNEIKVGEIFTWSWEMGSSILYKYSSKYAFWLNSEVPCYKNSHIGELDSDFSSFRGLTLFKLPLSTQRLWKEV